MENLIMLIISFFEKTGKGLNNIRNEYNRMVYYLNF